jgi:hypothetical protein
MRIHCILEARVRTFADTGQKQACVSWVDTRKHPGQTIGSPLSNHMQALLLRALREGVNIIKEEF